MAADNLQNVLCGIRWSENIEAFCARPGAAERIEKCLRRVAMWARQLEIADKANPALCFVREAQVQGHYVAALLGVALYKPAAGTMRALVENALYYSFFRSHPKELETLARDPGYFMQKADIVAFHQTHTDRFTELQEALGLVGHLNEWYRKISAIVHGQIPGQWVNHPALATLAHESSTLDDAVDTFEQAVDIVHGLFLVTVGRDLWHDFATEARKALLHELPGPAKKALGLSIA